MLPEGWFVPLVFVGSITSILLYALCFGVYSIIPFAIDAILLQGVLAQQWMVASLRTQTFRGMPLVEQMMLNDLGDEHRARIQWTEHVVRKLGK